MTEDERTKYVGLINLRNTEVTLRWTRTQIFLFINSIGLPLVVTQQLQHKPGVWFRILAGLTGLALVYLWFVTIRRASVWTRFWDAQLIFLEERPQDTPIRIFGGEAWVAVRWGRPIMDQVLRGLVFVFVVLWFLVIVSPLFW